MKIWAYVALAIIFIAGVGAAWAAAFNAGYDKRDAEIRDDAIVAQNEAIDKRMAEWIETQAQAEPVIIIEERIVEKIRVVEKEIPKIVKEIITLTPECSDLGDSYARLLNEQINASNSREDSAADTTSELATGVP